MKIVVAEDHPESRYLLQQLFAGLGHQVSAVADGLEVLELLGNVNAEAPDVVVSDALMPRMDRISTMPGAAAASALVPAAVYFLHGDVHGPGG
ncbi:MAG: response regulator [Nibricoccus sp.]